MRARLVAILLLSFATVAGAPSQSSWRTGRSRRSAPRDLPPGWKAQNWGSPKYDFEIVTDEGQRALHLKSASEGSTDLAGHQGQGEPQGDADPRVVVEGRDPAQEWRLVQEGHGRPGGAGLRGVAALPGGGALADHRLRLGHHRARGNRVQEREDRHRDLLRVRSGTADLGKWLTERRNVCEDYKRVYNEDCEPASAVSVAIDSNDTSSTAEAFIGAIFFKRP